MSSLLARLGHLQVRRTAYSIQTNGRKPSTNEAVCAECRASLLQALSQSRSYGDDGSFRTFDLKKRRRRDFLLSVRRTYTRQQRRIHDRTATVRETNPNALHDDSTSPSYPAQNAWPSEQAGQAVRDLENSETLTKAEQLKLWEFFERDDEEGGSKVRGSARRNASIKPFSRSKEGDEMLDIDYKSRLPVALLNREADIVIRCLFAALQTNDRDFLQEIPATTFSEIIRVLEPRHLMSSLASAHLELSPAMARQLGITPMREVAYEYASVLKEVVNMRRGVRLTLSDLKTLLRGARDLGHQKFALTLWNILLVEGYTLDTQCYNLYMSCVVWNGVHSAGARQKVRVIDHNMIARKQERPKNNFRQYRVGAGGVRETAMTIFNEMLANGVVANEETFRIVITAAAREGDITTMKSVFRKVWNIDVDAILAGEDETSITPKSLPTHSALHPTPELLFVIAHAFGVNNDIPSALRIVDFVARHYQIPITRMVWDQLFEWTFVLAVDRHGTDKVTGSEAGGLPPESVMSLWNTMTSPPYSIEPSMGMYNALIKNLFQRGNVSTMAEKMREARTLYYRHRKHARNIWHTLQDNLEGETLEKGSVEKLRHNFEAADLLRKRDLLWLKRWFRLLLASYRESHRGDPGGKGFATDLPRMLWGWRELAPAIVKFETPTGFVEFEIRTQEAIETSAMERFAHKTRRKERLKEAQRYVGDKWVEGEVRPAKRLLVKE